MPAWPIPAGSLGKPKILTVLTNSKQVRGYELTRLDLDEESWKCGVLKLVRSSWKREAGWFWLWPQPAVLGPALRLTAPHAAQEWLLCTAIELSH